MKHGLSLGIVAALMAAAAGCGPKVMVPPRIDLVQHEVIGIIEFTSSSEGGLASHATRKFTDAARRDQGMVRIVDLGSEAEVLREVGRDRLDQAAFQALGETRGINTIITGELLVSDVRPDISITPGFGFLSFAAEVDASLAVQMVETVSGASIWSSSASTTERVGHVSIFGGDTFTFDAEDPEEAYGRLVDTLVEETTRDFRVTWERK
ncbi:hypothetical protein AMJ71_07715 [candidate division TA06 bacterium SM1_40]|uniref:Penicillin-binding protein activator LpoB n=2 Tax=Bacteria division TA06 TaxID=1156500 RepID=A0A0S8JJD6_UNCT6|nr:MAG: hypothetical protein AMJ82_11170 [candidate division TA06 bacterium SM23_40]KPL08940.1 MAG: hypothetical protein AMJ71_07715 [candidate division TA06 bacterium SM1_40]